MRSFVLSQAVLLILFVTGVSAQEKGIDNQTKTIRDDSSRTDKGRTRARSFDWGGGKTKIREFLPNPYALNGRRDVLVKVIVDLLKKNKMIVDESASRLSAGLVVTKPVVFSKGAIITKMELNRYAVVPLTDQIWTRGRYALTIEVQSIDGMRNKVFVTAKVEGRSENGIFSEWSNLKSSGTAEDEFLSLLVDSIGGNVDGRGRKP